MQPVAGLQMPATLSGKCMRCTGGCDVIDYSLYLETVALGTEHRCIFWVRTSSLSGLKVAGELLEEYTLSVLYEHVN
jgi:hypothetical protein